jgi:L-rhamnose isomerase
VAHELISADLLDRTCIGLDFFDATISRTTAWVIGTRNMQKALLRALLTPWDRLRSAEARLDFTARLSLTEEFKDLPFGQVWSEFCTRLDTPCGLHLIRDLETYQSHVTSRG